MIHALQAMREDIERIHPDTEVKNTRLTSTLKQNPVSLPSSSSRSSHSHSFLFLFSLLSSKVVALFHSLPYVRGEQCQHTLLPWIRVRNPIRALLFPIFFSLLFLLSLTLPFCQGKERGGTLTGSLFFPAVSSFLLPCLCKHKHILSIYRKSTIEVRVKKTPNKRHHNWL